MCVLFTIHPWIHQCHSMCVLFINNNQSHFACVFSSHTTYGSTSVIACVFFLVRTTRVILHVCSFHIPPMDPPVSLKCVFSTEIAHGSTSVIACVFFLVTTTRVIFHVYSFHIPPMDPPVSLHVCSFHNPPMDPPVSLHVCSF